MTFRSEGELVFAVNAARDLTNLAIACLEFYRRYAQGLLGIWIPVEPFTVVFLPLDNANSLKVRLVYTKTSNHQEPVYYDVDDDNYSESWGASNLSDDGRASVLYTVQTIAFLKGKPGIVDQKICRK
jgi:hypothetical protein